MKYKYFSILFLAVLLVFGHITFSDSESSTLEKPQAWWEQNIPEASIITEITAAQEELYELAYSRERFENMETTFRESHDLITQTRGELEAYVAKIDQMQKDIEGNITQSIERKQALETDLSALEKEIKHLQNRQLETKDYIRKMIVDGYKLDMEETADMSMYGILFQKAFGTRISETDTLHSLQDSASQLLERQKSIEELLTKLSESMAVKIQAKKRIISRLENYQEELQSTQGMKREILSQTLAEENLEKRIERVAIKKNSIAVKIEAKFAEYEKNLQTKVAQLNCDTQKSATCIWIRGYIRAEKELISSNTQTGEWMWPLSPEKWFGYHFRDQKYFNSMDVHHEGLDILADAGTPVQSMGNGYILMKQSPNASFPAGMVIIKHPGGLISMYIGVTPGNHALFSRVTWGETIATSRSHTEHSQQNNVHIELYENGKPTDALEKLDMSSLSAGIVPARYGWKYIDDLKRAKKNPDIVSLQKTIGFFYLGGDTEAERQQKLLEKYASDDFRDRTIWVEESIVESIDPTFVLCVGLAESTLGKNLTTNGNIGNVGNTDSGARRDYGDSRTGIRAISSVVNNTWLGGYTTIDQLSGWGNPVGPIYASSPTNWHENIVKCMSAIKGKYIGNTSNFRLSRAALLIYEQEGFQQNRETPKDV